MQVTHKISRTKAGMLGGTAFSVFVRVTLSADEKAVLDELGASTSFEIDGERFNDVKGANHGFMRLDGFTSGAEFKLPNIQQASDFLAQVLGGLQQVKNQIDASGSLPFGL
jgi:hypothetical protein